MLSLSLFYIVSFQNWGHLKGKALETRKDKFLEELENFIKCLGSAQTSVNEQTFHLTHIDIKTDIVSLNPSQYSSLGKCSLSSVFLNL